MTIFQRIERAKFLQKDLIAWVEKIEARYTAEGRNIDVSYEIAQIRRIGEELATLA